MSSLSIRNLDRSTKRRLRVRAAENGVSMEEEARRILGTALADNTTPAQNPPESFGGAIRQIFEPLGGVELELPPRERIREPPDFL